jgi:hypothetical protein
MQRAALSSTSEAFGAWDAFDHKSAAGGLAKAIYNGLPIDGRSDWSDLAAALVREQSAPWRALHLRDLWRNAQRCAARSRWDDAVARLYRLWEAMAQCLIWVCAVTRRRFPVGASPTRQPLQPEATGAGMEVTKCLKPSDSGSRNTVTARVCRPQRE